MADLRRVKVVGLVVALLLSATTLAKQSDPDEVQFVALPGAIDAITDPGHGSEGDAAERVIGVAIDGDARAYPIPMLDFHEVVDDTVGDRPIVVTYCPLCATGIVYDRRVDDRTLTFEVSGRLYRNNLVMRDTQTGSLWSQVEGRAIEGPLKGANLTIVPSTIATLSVWRGQHPETTVMQPPSGRSYDSDPYAGYDQGGDPLYPSKGTPGPLGPKALVYGVTLRDHAKAYAYSDLAPRRVVEDVVGGVEIVVTYHAGAVQAFRTGGRNFTADDGFRMLDEDGDAWNMVTGEGPDANLTRVDGLPSFWFAWTDFHPDTELFGATVGTQSSGRHLNLLHPLTMVLLGVAAWSVFQLGLWVRRRWWDGETVSGSWFEPEHGWVHGVLVGLVGAAALFDATQAIQPVHRWGQGLLAVALVGWGIGLGLEWWIDRDGQVLHARRDPDAVADGLAAALGEPARADGPPWTAATIGLGERGTVRVSPFGSVSIPAGDDELRGIVAAELAPPREELK